MAKAQIEKEHFVEYFESSISSMKEVIHQTEEIDEMDLRKNPQIRHMMMDLIHTIHSLRRQDLEFYRKMLNQLPQLELFKDEVSDMDELQGILADSILSEDRKTNAFNFAQLMKSARVFYFINKKSQQEGLDETDLALLGDVGLIKEYFKAVWPSAKQEELLGVLLYINSGRATEDYLHYLKNHTEENKEDYLYEQFKKSFKDLKVYRTTSNKACVEITEQKNHKITPASYMDSGVVIDSINREVYLGFATANYQTEEQLKQFFEKMKILREAFANPEHELAGYKIKPAYITNSLINENELSQGDKEHKKSLLESFSQNLSREEKNRINCASFLALAGNISMEDVLDGVDIADFLQINPYVSGADTLWIHDKFKEIKKLDRTQQLVELRNFLIDSAYSLLTVFEKIPDYELTQMSDNHAAVLKHMEKMTISAIENFNILNMPQEHLVDHNFLKKVADIANLYQEIHLNKFAGSVPGKNDLLKGKDFYFQFENENNVLGYMERLQKDLSQKVRIRQVQQEKANQRKEIVKKECDQIAQLVSPLFKDKVSVFSHPEVITSSLSEILYLANLYPAREIEPLLAGESDFKQSSNFIKNYKNWKANKTHSGENEEKFRLANIVLDNAKDFLKLKQELEAYHEQYDFKPEKKLNKMKALFVNGTRRRHAAEIRRHHSQDNLFNYMVKRHKQGKEINHDYLIAFLQVKAENVQKSGNNGNYNNHSVASFNRCLDIVKELKLDKDPDVQTAFKIGLPELTDEREKQGKPRIS
jgi:hypothetical protein